MDTLQRSLSESCFTDEDEEIGLVPRDSQIPSSTASRFYERESIETFKQFHIYCIRVIKTHSWLQTNIEYLSPVLVVIQIWYTASRIICLTTQRNQNKTLEDSRTMLWMTWDHIFCNEIKILNSGSHVISQKLRQTKSTTFFRFEG